MTVTISFKVKDKVDKHQIISAHGLGCLYLTPYMEGGEVLGVRTPPNDCRELS